MLKTSLSLIKFLEGNKLLILFTRYRQCSPIGIHMIMRSPVQEPDRYTFIHSIINAILKIEKKIYVKGSYIRLVYNGLRGFFDISSNYMSDR